MSRDLLRSSLSFYCKRSICASCLRTLPARNTPSLSLQARPFTSSVLVRSTSLQEDLTSTSNHAIDPGNTRIESSEQLLVSLDTFEPDTIDELKTREDKILEKVTSESRSKEEKLRVRLLLRKGQASDREVDGIFLGLLRDRRFTEATQLFTTWKSFLKSGTQGSRLEVTRLVVFAAYVCTRYSQQVWDPQDLEMLNRFFEPLQPPRQSTQTISLLQKLGLLEMEVVNVDKLLDAIERVDLRPNTPAFLAGISNLVSKYQPESLLNLYRRARRHHMSLESPAYHSFAEGFLKIGRPEYARDVLQDMRQASIALEPSLWNALLVHAARSRNAQAVRALWVEITRNSVLDTTLYTSLIDAYFQAGEPDQALAMLQTMSQSPSTLPNSITCNVVVKGLVQNDRAEAAAQFVEETAIPAGMVSDTTTFNTLLKAFLNKGLMDKANAIVAKMKSLGFRDIATYTILVDQLSKQGLTTSDYSAKAKTVLKQMIREDIVPNAYIYSTIMKNILRARSGADRDAPPSAEACTIAHDYLRTMRKDAIPRTIVVYEVLLSAYMQRQDYQAAFGLWSEMRRDRIAPDSGAFTTMVKGLVSAGLLSEALQLCDKSYSSGLKKSHLYIYVLDVAIEKNDKMMANEVLKKLFDNKMDLSAPGTQRSLREANTKFGLSHTHLIRD